MQKGFVDNLLHFLRLVFELKLNLLLTQNSIALQITHIINENLNSEIKIDEVSLRSFDHFQLNQILIPDLNGDTILFVPNAVIKFNKWKHVYRRVHTLPTIPPNFVNASSRAINTIYFNL